MDENTSIADFFKTIFAHKSPTEGQQAESKLQTVPESIQSESVQSESKLQETSNPQKSEISVAENNTQSVEALQTELQKLREANQLLLARTNTTTPQQAVSFEEQLLQLCVGKERMKQYGIN